MDWFLYDNGLRHERVKVINNYGQMLIFFEIQIKIFNRWI